MGMQAQTYYEMLEVSPEADFHALKKAYYRKAKEYHPDLFPDDPEKEEQFKRLVEAFDVLSDPIRRRTYEEHIRDSSAGTESYRPGYEYAENETAIMDTCADDILEEIIVGNTIPRNTTLKTLMLDLENTEKFIRFREAKNLFYNGNIHEANALFETAIRDSPNNILYRYYLARSFALFGRWRKSEKHLQIAIRVGSMRIPPLKLTRFHNELAWIRKNRMGILGRLRARAKEKENRSVLLDEGEEMRRQAARTLEQIHRKQEKSNSRKLPR